MSEEGRAELYEKERVRGLLGTALNNVEAAMKYPKLWSCATESSVEHELGRLDVAKYAIKAVLEDL